MPLKTLSTDLTVIIPIKPSDVSWIKLLPDLSLLSPGSEIILVANATAPDLFDKQIYKTGIQGHTQWIQSSGSLPTQLNAAAQASTKSHLWFLLPNTRVSSSALGALEKAIQARSSAVHFFDIHYLHDGPNTMQINSLGHWIRGHVFRLPTLKNGLVIPKEAFQRLGGFREDLSEGSEQHFVMKAKAQGYSLHFAQESLQASSKLHQLEGWGKTTTQGFFKINQQTLPAVWTYIKAKVRKN
jgi:hypothetical protein